MRSHCSQRAALAALLHRHPSWVVGQAVPSPSPPDSVNSREKCFVSGYFCDLLLGGGNALPFSRRKETPVEGSLLESQLPRGAGKKSALPVLARVWD
jgi:hypothetical protein